MSIERYIAFDACHCIFDVTLGNYKEGNVLNKLSN